MRRKKWIFFSVLAVFSLFFIGNRSAVWLYKINFYYQAQHKKFVDSYLKTISSAEKDFLNKHIKNALSSLETQEESEVVAAINDYLFQFLLLKRHQGLPLDVLKDQHAICGGHGSVMSTMLSELNIANRMICLLDVPYQGSHVLVEVYFKDGRKGLFDPTFGLYWFDLEKNRYLSLDDLKKTPILAGTKILKTKHKKRTTTDEEIQAFRSIATSYKPLEGPDELHFSEIFSSVANIGFDEDSFKVFQRIPLSSERSVLGDPSAKDIKASFSKLISESGKTGNPICCVHQLGKPSGGGHINVSHIYELKDLKPKQPYKLTLYYSKSIESVISSTVVGGRFYDTTKQTCHEVVADFAPKVLQMVPLDIPGKSRSVTFQILPNQAETNLIVDNSGEMILHAISVEPLLTSSNQPD